MQRRIIVPLDGSRPAEHALPHAVALARATDRELTLLHVVTLPQATNPLAWGVRAVSTASAIRDEMVESAYEYLRSVAQRLGSQASEGMAVAVEVLEGDAAEAIVVYAEQHPEVVMTVMTTRGRSGLTRWVLGSVAEKVLQASPVPLVLIRPQVGSENQAELDASAFGRQGLPGIPNIPTYRTILVPLDVSLLAEEALPHARGLAAATGAALLLVSVMPLPYPIDLPVPATRDDADGAEAGSLLPPRLSVAKALKEVYEREQVALTQYLASVARRLMGAGTPGIEVRVRDLEGDAAKEILRASSEGGADLIVMSTHGRGGLARVWPGSVAMSVVREAALPVLLVPAHLAR